MKASNEGEARALFAQWLLREAEQTPALERLRKLVVTRESDSEHRRPPRRIRGAYSTPRDRSDGAARVDEQKWNLAAKLDQKLRREKRPESKEGDLPTAAPLKPPAPPKAPKVFNPLPVSRLKMKPAKEDGKKNRR